MSTKVIYLQEKMDSKQPHIVIQCDTNRVHVLPESVFHDIASRRMDIVEVDYWKDITRAIIKEWLHLIRDGRHE